MFTDKLAGANGNLLQQNGVLYTWNCEQCNLIGSILDGVTAYHFQYDGNGNVTEITEHNGNSAASYR